MAATTRFRRRILIVDDDCAMRRLAILPIPPSSTPSSARNRGCGPVGWG